MGVYINPAAGTKEDWLKQYAKPATREAVENHDFSDPTLPVILIDNYIFTAAAVEFNAEETKVCAASDGRTKSYWVTPRYMLKGVVPREDFYHYIESKHSR